ncbi:ribonuclease R [Deinococcus altitudinis]|uniref:ribonuclease R n=1 Tax=Deinococcus altitudinis TaxID=468914 RepID=UPI003892303D
MPKSSKERGAKTPDATPQDSSVQKRASKAKNAAPDVQQKPERRGKKNLVGETALATEAMDINTAPEPLNAEAPAQAEALTPQSAPKARGKGRNQAASVPAAETEPLAPAALPAGTRGRKPGKAKAAKAEDATEIESVQVESTPAETADDAGAAVTTSEDMAAAPVRRGRGKGRKAEQVAAAPVAEPQLDVSPVQVEPDRVEEAQSEIQPSSEQPALEAAPARKGRRGAKPLVAEAAPEPEAAAVETASPPRRGRRSAAKTEQDTATAPELVAVEAAGPEAVQAEPAETQAAEPLDTEPLKTTPRRGRKSRAEKEAEHALAEALRADEVPAGDIQTAPVEVAAQPVEQPVSRRGRKGRKVAEVQPDDVQPDHVETDDVSTDAVLAEPVAAEVDDAEQQDDQDDAQASAGTTAQSLVVDQLRKLGRPVHIRDFERSFTRQGREKLGQYRSDLTGLMDELVHAGVVIQTRKRTYGLPEAMNLVRARFQASASGFGFAIPDSGGPDSGGDYYIPEGKTMEAWNGDTVLIRPEGRGGRRGDSPAGVVVRVVVRAATQLVGSLEHSHGYAFLKPDDVRNKHRIMLVPEGLEGLPDGARMVTELYWPEDTGEDEVYGQVLKVLGNEDDPETETQAVVIKYGLRDEFPPEVLEEAEAVPVKIPEAALSGRLDLRSYNIFTVDGRDAKDFDDAIHIQPTPEGNFVVGVHIADVSHYVRAGQPLDDEAYARATSVYLPGRVLPMLPEHLSNGVCSLVPDEDRLTLSALIEINLGGDILDVKLAPSVIRSKARLTYDEVQAYSEAVATLPEQARALEGDLHLLLKITSRLRQRRLREGALDFKMREVKVDVGKDGHLELVPVREETARGMIEDLMLLANKVVAGYLLERNVPALYRIHEEPTLARFQDVSSAIGRLGLSFPGGQPTPQAYQAVLKQVRGTGQETAVNTLLLRSMQQAKYAGENLGHFGLAFGEYLHFTSPIRRYPDLLVHRMLKASLSGELTDRIKANMEGRLAEMGRHTSERERTASEAERDLTKYYQAKWAQENLDGVFPGYVSGVIASGLFVALENGVEGRIHISNLEDDYYLYIEEAGILKGKTSGKVFRVGENITIRITQVNPLARQVEFSQESNMDGNEVKPRARRGGERETSKREKLSTMVPSVRTSQDRTSQEEQQQAAPTGSRPVRSEGGQTARSDARPARSGESRSSERPVQRSASSVSGGGKRRIVTLDRPRNEHLRPVNVTVQRMYFGDWTLENMPPEDGQGGGNFRGNGGSGSSFRGGRPQQGGRTGSERPSGRAGQSSGRGSDSRSDGRSQESRAPRQQVTVAPQNSAVSAAAATPGESAEDANKRRRRRRGRRGGNGGSAQG